jgi:2-polyprenylphenol 6-hydroxylase
LNSRDSKQPGNRHDVIVVGGGMVGAALTCGLAEAGLGVALIELHEPQREWPAEEIDLRVSAINRGSQLLLQNLGAWPAIMRRGAHPYREMRVWDKRERGEIHFDSAAIGEADLGHIIQNRTIVAALWEQLEGMPGIHRYLPATVDRVVSGGSEISVVLDGGEHLHAQLLIAADGSNSQVRNMAGIAVAVHDFQQRAVVATVTMAESHGDTAWQHFLPSGPLAFLPVTPSQCSIVWSTTAEHAERLLSMADDAFCHALAEASERRLGEVVASSARAAYPLLSQQAVTYIGERLALVGDAAHQIHPLAGQGANLGFRDAAALIDVIIEARAQQRPLGSRSILRRYERARRGDNLLTQRSMEAINRLFSNDLGALRELRSLGLAITDRVAPAKAFFMRRALGIDGESPTLCRAHGNS